MNATDSNQPNIKRSSNQNRPFYQSMIFKVFALLFLLALALIPISGLQSLVDTQLVEEQNINDVMTKSWGNQQTIIGPVLSIPYVERISRIQSQTDSNGVKSSVSRDTFNNKTLMLLPENLSIKAKIKDKLLTKNNLEAHVYQGEIELSGNFNVEALPEASGYNTIEWDKAFVAIGLSDNKSIEPSTPLRWEGSSTKFDPGTQLPTLLDQGIHATLGEVANDNALPTFKILLNVKGVESLQFAPLGQLSSINITSDISSTAVAGDITAASKVSSTDGFEATWRISNLARNYPQQWLIEEDQKEKPNHNLAMLLTGVENLASKTSTNNSYLINIKRIIENLALILGVIFLSLLILEFKRNSLSKPKFIHYLIVSLPVLLMPLLLLALYQVMSFPQAYQIVAVTCVILLVLFVSSIMRSFAYGFYTLLIVSSLYAAQFINIEMQQFSLIANSLAGVGITAILMLVSYNIKDE